MIWIKDNECKCSRYKVENIYTKTLGKVNKEEFKPFEARVRVDKKTKDVISLRLTNSWPSSVASDSDIVPCWVYPGERK